MATDKQWRAAIASGDLKPDAMVGYEAPGRSAETRLAGDVPELQPLFAELLSGGPVQGNAAEPSERAKPVLPSAPAPRPTPVPVPGPRPAPASAAQQPPPQPTAHPPEAPGGAAKVPPARPAGAPVAPAARPPAQRTGQAGKGERAPLLLGLAGAVVVAVILLSYVLPGGGDNEQDSADQVAALPPQAAPAEPLAIETAPAEDPVAPAPSAAPSPTSEAQRERERERQRLRREAAALPTPSAAPTFAPPPPPPVVVSKARGVEPQNMARWASRIGSDYPRRAQERGEEGTVGFRVTVGPNGRVETCDVTRSSGSADLDKAACQGMRRFARFTPALNDAGEPIASTWASALEFRLE